MSEIVSLTLEKKPGSGLGMSLAASGMGVKIKGVTAGSVAAAAGAQAGDILVEVAGTALAASSNVMQATKLIKGAQGTFSIAVRRGDGAGAAAAAAAPAAAAPAAAPLPTLAAVAPKPAPAPAPVARENSADANKNAQFSQSAAKAAPAPAPAPAPTPAPAPAPSPASALAPAAGPVSEVTEALRKLGLPSEYEKVLDDEGIDSFDTLAAVSVDELRSIGFKLGHAKKLKMAVPSEDDSARDLGSPPPPPLPTTAATAPAPAPAPAAPQRSAPAANPAAAAALATALSKKTGSAIKPPVVGTKICDECKKPISDKQYLEAIGKYFHQGCFICNFCTKPLEGQFSMEDGKRQCISCAQEQGDMCARCGKTVLVPDPMERLRVVYLDDKAYHPDCFTCKKCNCPLAGEDGDLTAYPVAGEMYCKVCAREVKSGRAPAPSAGGGNAEPKALGSVVQGSVGANLAKTPGGKTRFDRLAEQMGTDNSKGARKW